MSRIITLLFVFLCVHSLSAQRCHELTLRFGTNISRLDNDHINILEMFEKGFPKRTLYA